MHPTSYQPPPFLDGPATKPLPEAECNALVLRAQAGDKRAADRVIASHVRWCRKRAARWRFGPVHIDDLVAMGLWAIGYAMARWDSTRGIPFQAYAFPYVDMLVKNLVKREATVVKKTLTHWNTSTPQDRFALMVSLDAPLNDDTDQTRLDALARHEVTPEAEFGDAESAERAKTLIERFLVDLPDRERDIFRRRIVGDPPMLLEELATAHGVSRERVRQIELRLLERFAAFMGRPTKADELRARMTANGDNESRWYGVKANETTSGAAPWTEQLDAPRPPPPAAQPEAPVVVVVEEKPKAPPRPRVLRGEACRLCAQPVRVDNRFGVHNACRRKQEATAARERAQAALEARPEALARRVQELTAELAAEHSARAVLEQRVREAERTATAPVIPEHMTDEELDLCLRERARRAAAQTAEAA